MNLSKKLATLILIYFIILNTATIALAKGDNSRV